jgi:hypothetical protein
MVNHLEGRGIRTKAVARLDGSVPGSIRFGIEPARFEFVLNEEYRTINQILAQNGSLAQ